MGCPVLVSRVAPGPPADQGYPRLNEGDQLMQINGRDTALMTHRDIVTSIRHAATVRKELLLRVRQNGKLLMKNNIRAQKLQVNDS